jgi:hypothetical protein
MTKELLEQWWRGKLETAGEPFRGFITIGYEYDKVTGPRHQYAKVVLSASPAEEFSFISEAVWPQENCEPIILQAILDVVFTTPGPPSGIQFLLKEIGWHDLYSSEQCFYRAARSATIAIFKECGYSPCG